MKDHQPKLLIIDDEQEACDNLQNILAQYLNVNIDIVGTANDTLQAEALIQKYKPDAVFLDIEMPGENAFQFLERIYGQYDFELIFVTAYDEFAIKAFKLNAVDYIQKPINIDELQEAIVKLNARIDYRQFTAYDDRLNTLKRIADREPQYKITLRSLNHVEVVDFKNILFIEGQGSYCKISFRSFGLEKEITTSNIIAYYEDLLPTSMFYRVHKSFLVNCAHITGIIKQENYYIELTSTTRIPVSRRRYPAFIRYVEENNFYNE